MYKYAYSLPGSIAESKAWLDALSKASFHRLEYSCGHIDDFPSLIRNVQVMKELQDRGGVEIGSIHIPFGRGWEYADLDEAKRAAASASAKKFIEICAPLGSKNFTLHGCLEPMPLEYPARGECIKSCRRTLAELVPVAEKYNISINVEDLPRSCLGNTAEELAEMVDGFPLEQIGVCFDVNHFCGHPEKLADGIRLLAPRIRTFHISDYDGVDECHWYPGLGVIDWPAIMDAVRELPNDVLLMFELNRVSAPEWQRRVVKPEIIIQGMARNVYYLENAAKIKAEISRMTIA